MANTRTNKEKLYDIIKKPKIKKKLMANNANNVTPFEVTKDT